MQTRRLRPSDLPWPGGATSEALLFGEPPAELGELLMAWSDADASGKVRGSGNRSALQLLIVAAVLVPFFCGCPMFFLGEYVVRELLDIPSRSSGLYSLSIAFATIVIILAGIALLIRSGNTPRCVYVGRAGIADIAWNGSGSRTMRFDQVAYCLSSSSTFTATALGVAVNQETNISAEFFDSGTRSLLCLVEGGAGTHVRTAPGIEMAVRAWTESRLQSWWAEIKRGGVVVHPIILAGHRRAGALEVAAGRLTLCDEAGNRFTFAPSNIVMRIERGCLRLLSPQLPSGTEEYSLASIGNVSGMLALLSSQGFSFH